MLVNQNLSENPFHMNHVVNKRIHNYPTDMKISLYENAKVRQMLIRKNPYAAGEKSMNAGRPMTMISKCAQNGDKHIQAKKIIAANLDILNNDHSFNMPSNKMLLNINNGRNQPASLNLNMQEGGSASMSKVLMDSMQSKERLIHHLKGNMSLDKLQRKKKILNNENSHYADQESPMHSGEREKDENGKSSYAFHSNLFSYMKNTKKEEPLKIYTENHMTTTSFNNNLSFEGTPLNANANQTKSFFLSEKPSTYYHSQNASDLERQLEELLKNISIEKQTNEKNRMIINAKSYNAYKKIFEEVIKISPEHSVILRKLLTGFHEVVMNFAGENKAIKDNADIVINKYANLNKKYFETSKLLKEKESEINILKKRITQLEAFEKSVDIKKNGGMEAQAQMNADSFNEEKNPPHSSSHNDISGQIATKEEESNQASKNSEVIFNINKKIVEDLDALYFFDKVQMRPKSVTPSTVPKLQFTFPAKKSTNKQETNDAMKEKEEPYKIIGSKYTLNVNQQAVNINAGKIGMNNNSSNGHLNTNEGGVLNKISANSTKATNSSKSLKNEGVNFKLGGVNKIEMK